MQNRTPLADLVLNRIKDLGLDHTTLGQRLGYENPVKAAGRVYALCDGNIPLSSKSRHVIRTLHAALDVPAAVVARVVAETDEIAASEARKAAAERQAVRDREEAAWRASFVPHAVLQTSLTVPSQITICGMTGGARRWLHVPLDVSQPPITFIGQALAAVPHRTRLGTEGRRSVMFFGLLVGIVVNFSPDHAIRFGLDGEPLEVLPKAYRPGEVELSMGGRRVEPKVMATIIGSL